MSSKNNNPEQVLRQETERFEALKAELANVGLFRRGSLTSIYARCGSKRCSCQKDPSRKHGPYLQWTRKVEGKTVTLRLRRDQEAMFLQWIDNGHRLDELLRQIQQTSLTATDAILRLQTERRTNRQPSGVKKCP